MITQNLSVSANDISGILYNCKNLINAKNGTQYVAADKVDNNWGKHNGWCSDSYSYPCGDGFFNEYHNPNNDPARFAIRLKTSDITQWTSGYLLSSLKLNIYMGCAKNPSNLKGYCYVFTKDMSSISTFASAEDLVNTSGFLKVFEFDIPSISIDSYVPYYRQTTINMDFSANKIKIKQGDYEYLYFYFIATCTSGWTKTGVATFPRDSSKAATWHITLKEDTLTFRFYNLPGLTNPYTITETCGNSVQNSQTLSYFNKYCNYKKDYPYAISFYSLGTSMGTWSDGTDKTSDILNKYPCSSHFSYNNSSPITGTFTGVCGKLYKDETCITAYDTDFSKSFGNIFNIDSSGKTSYDFYYKEEENQSLSVTIKKSDLSDRVSPDNYYKNLGGWIFIEYDNIYTKNDTKNIKIMYLDSTVSLPIYIEDSSGKYIGHSIWLAYPCGENGAIGIEPIEYGLYTGKINTDGKQVTGETTSSVQKIGTFTCESSSSKIASLINTCLSEYSNCKPGINTISSNVSINYSTYPTGLLSYSDENTKDGKCCLKETDDEIRKIYKATDVNTSTFIVDTSITPVNLEYSKYNSYSFDNLSNLLNKKSSNNIVLTSLYSYKFIEDSGYTTKIWIPNKTTILSTGNKEYKWSGCYIIDGYLTKFSEEEIKQQFREGTTTEKEVNAIALFYPTSADTITYYVPFIMN